MPDPFRRLRMSVRNAEELLGKYCRERVPEHLQEKLRILFKVQGIAITILEERPHFMRPLLWTLCPVAQFRYKASTGEWTLYCRDRNQKWHKFTPESPSEKLSDLIDAVERDDTKYILGVRTFR